MAIAPRIINIPHTTTVLKVGAISDGVTSAIQQGMDFLSDHMQDKTNHHFRAFVDALHDTIVCEGVYELSGVIHHYQLSDEECYQAITVLLRAAHRFAPSAVDELTP